MPGISGTSGTSTSAALPEARAPSLARLLSRTCLACSTRTAAQLALGSQEETLWPAEVQQRSAPQYLGGIARKAQFISGSLGKKVL
jgi:hypothetical protein